MAVTARFIANFDSFHDAVRKADVGLKEFESGAGDVRKALERMTDTFSGRKLISDALLMEKAIQNVGGVSVLTGKELHKAGIQAAEAIEIMKKGGRDVPPGLQKIADAAHLNTSAFGTMGVSFGKLVASFVTAQAIIGAVKTGFHTLTGFVAGSVQAANDAEKANVQMVAALRAQGTAIPSVISAFHGYAEALQRTTVFQDDAIEGSIALLVQIGNVMPRDMQKALHATTELASGLGIDLHQATMMVAKAAEGNTLALKKLGVETKDVQGKALDFGSVLDSITDKFGGQAAAIAGTYQGRLQQLGNTWNDVQESIGRVITQNATVLLALDNLNNGIDSNTGELKDNAKASLFVSEAVILSVKSFAALVTAIDAVQTYLASAVIVTREGAAALGDIAMMTLKAARAMYLFKGEKLDKDIATLESAVKELGDRNEATTKRSVSMGQSLSDMATKAGLLAKELEATKGKVIALSKGVDDGSDAWGPGTKGLVDHAKAAKDAADAFDKMLERFDDFEIGVPKATGKLLEFNRALNQTVAPQIKLVDGLGLLGVQFGRALPKLQAMDAGLGIMRPSLVMTGEDLDEVREKTDQFGAVVSRVSTILQNAFTGGGGLAGAGKAIGVEITESLAKSLTSTVNMTTKAGMLMGGAMTAGLGLAIGGWVSVLSGLKKKQDEVMRTNDVRDAYISALGPQGAGGTLTDLAAKAQKAGFEIKGMLRARTVTEFTAEVDKLNRALDFQNGALDKLADAEEKYHLSLDKTSAGLFESYQLMVGRGRDANVVLRAMKDDWIALVVEARKWGIALPAALKPMLEALRDGGELADDDKDKLGDLSDIRFDDTGESGESAFDRIKESVDRLVAAVKLFVGRELTDLENKLLGINQQFDALHGGRPQGPGSEPVGGGPAIPRPREVMDTFLTPTQAGALSTNGSGTIVLNATVMLPDGQVLGRITQKYLEDEYRNQFKSRAA